MRRFRLQLTALFAVLAVLLSGGAAAHAQYRCRMSGRILEACCCAKVAAHAAQSGGTEARPADCCELVVTQARAAATQTFEETRKLPAATITAFPVLLTITPPQTFEDRLVLRDRAPLAIGPPLFIKNCSLLS
jgi:hypothetical protein